MNLYLAVGVVLVAVFAVASSVLIEQFCRGLSFFFHFTAGCGGSTRDLEAARN